MTNSQSFKASGSDEPKQGQEQLQATRLFNEIASLVEQQQQHVLADLNRVVTAAFAQNDRLLQSLTGEMVSLLEQQQKQMMIEAGRVVAATLAQNDQLLQSFTKAFVQSTSELRDRIAHQMVAVAESIRATFESAEIDAKTVGPLLLQAGFWLPPSAPLGLLYRVKALSEQGDASPELVRHAFLAYFEENHWAELCAMVEAWEENPRFTPRMAVIQDALEAHLAGKYSLSIPALLPQVEGIASDILAAPAGSSVSLLRATIQGEMSDFMAAASRDILLTLITSPALYGGTKSQSQDFRSENFQGWLASKGLTEGQALNRHGILHGVQVNYASAENSLRAFLLLAACRREPAG
ncbi:MAG: hypothetical protein IT318_27420 [Anaerolineales bacterium]|nr:hypothetical protein [Anaerolineales bacterium]